jgi:hypothetical protein
MFLLSVSPFSTRHKKPKFAQDILCRFVISYCLLLCRNANQKMKHLLLERLAQSNTYCPGPLFCCFVLCLLLKLLVTAFMIYFYRLLESWHTKQAPLVEIMKSLLEQQSLGIRMALAEVMLST